MLAKESAASNFDLPDEILAILPPDPFEQLDVARKITSLALFSRISALESEISELRENIADKDSVVGDLQSRVRELESALSDSVEKLSQADFEKETLLKENVQLSNTVKKLQRDVAKLEVFRKTLMQSLQEDEDNPGSSGPRQIIAKPTPTDDDVRSPTSRASSVGNSSTEDHESEVSRPGISRGFLLTSQTTTPRFTPPGSPPSLSARVSPTRTSQPVSPKRHSMSFSTSRGFTDDRSSIFSSLPPNAGRARIDGKEFFRQVRTRLSYEQFGAFLANVKELNSHKQTKEETLRKAEGIFGSDNKDLYVIFKELITRNIN